MIELVGNQIRVPKFHDAIVDGFEARQVWIVESEGVVTMIPWSRRRKLRFLLNKLLSRHPQPGGVTISNCTMIGDHTPAIKVSNDLL